MNYTEPFFGSGAVLLARPTKAGNEIINDKDCYVANAWRAMQHDPESVSYYVDSPVNEADLHARHRWLHAQTEFRQRMENEPDFYDPKIACWWIWGLSCWIGDNFCRPKNQDALPHLTGGKGDRGVNARSIRTSSQVPKLVDRSINMLSIRGSGTSSEQTENLIAWFDSLSDRIRFTKICCGDWSRVVTKAATWGQGMTAVFLDPPYDTTGHDDVYGDLSRGISAQVYDWAMENQDNPLLRIALCGYEGEHAIPDSWECVEWKAVGGYGNQSGNQNRHRERIWFSPACLKPTAGPLFKQ
jgi:hypothetical protein